MRVPDNIKQVYAQHGPFATVYLDATRSTEHGAGEVALRWREQRGVLSRAGADDATLAALDAALENPPRTGGPRGRVLAAADGRVVFDEVLPQPPVRPFASWAPLPALVPYLAQRGPAIAHVLVVADRTGADVSAVSAEHAAEGLAPDAQHTVEGSQPYPVTKTSVRDWSEQHFQQRVENSWAANAKDVAAAVRTAVAEVGAEAVLVAGDARARALLEQDLPAVLDQHVQVVGLEHGARGAGASAGSLAESVRDALLKLSWHRRHEVLTHLQQNVGRERFAATGTAEVLGALQRSQVDTVVLSDDPSSPLTAWVGPEPLQVAGSAEELGAMGVREPRQDRYDSALLRAVIGSDAELLITPNAHDYVRGGVGALLRYDDAATPAP
jgi:hypothetical protein